MSNKVKHLYEFNNFRFDAESLCLTYKDEEIRLPLKSLETLKILLERRGEIIEREFLLEKIWTDSYVEDSNLTVTVSQIRKTLAKYDEAVFVETLPKRGYRFTNNVHEIIEEAETPLIIEKHTLERLTIEEQDQTQPKLLPKPKNYRQFAVIGILLIVLFSIGGWFYWKSLAEKNDGKINSLAVLPLKNLNENEETKPLSLGLTDNLINRLGSLNRFVVRPLSAVSKYEQSGKDAIKFGEDLGVDAVLEGTIQQVENRLRINVRLISVKDNSQIWEGNFDETETDILKLQDKLSTQVAGSLISRLTLNEKEKLSVHLTQNTEAYEAYLKGRYFWNKRTKDDLKKAITHFQQAVELDKNFAEAYVGLADSQYLLFDYNWDTSPENPVQAKENLLKALSVNPNLSDALVTLGLIRTTYDWDWEQAENSLKRALEIEPNSSQGLHRYGMLLVRLRRFSEAQELLKKARELDPLSVSINMNYGVSMLFAKDLQKAERQLQQTLEIDPKFTPARWYLARCYWQQGKKDQAIAEFIQALNDSGEQTTAQKMLESSGVVEDKVRIWYEDWHKQFDKKVTDGHDLAFAASFLQDKELTISWLENSVESHNTWAAWIYAEPEFDFVRDDPRFIKLMKKMKFSE